MFSNAKPSELTALLDAIAPVSQGVGAATTGWISMAACEALLAVINTGVLGTAATVDAKLQQATSAAGANAKDITGKAITQIVKATGDGKQAFINLRSQELDVQGGFAYVQLSVTVGAAASLISADVLGFYNRDMPPSNNATLVQTV